MKRPRTVDFATKLSDSKIIQFPFAHASIDCPFDEEFTANLRAQVLMQPFQLKSNDLYEFYQSKDLIGSKKPLVREFVDTIYSTETVAAMSALFGIELSGTVDFSAHRYPTDGYV